MNPRDFYCERIVVRRESKDERTLTELENEVKEISKRIAAIKTWGLTTEVTALAIREMREQIKTLKILMHNKVNEM